jgi:hypothetical protein
MDSMATEAMVFMGFILCGFNVCQVTLNRMHLSILGGARANGLEVLIVPMSLRGTLKATIEQTSHDLLIVRNVSITVQTKDMSLSGGVLIGNGESGVHSSILVTF